MLKCKNWHNYFLSTVIFSLFGLLMVNAKVVNADSVEITGQLHIKNEAIFQKSELGQNDINGLKLLPSGDSNWTYKELNGKIIVDEALSSSGAIVQTSVDKTQENFNQFKIKIDPNAPTIDIKSKLGDVIKTVNLSSENLKNKTVNVEITNNLLSKLAHMNEGMDNSNTPMPSSMAYYPGQQNGKHYNAGVHVQCNDFNGKYNTSHYYWYKGAGTSAAAKAVKNFVGSDCDWHDIEYGCQMNGNKKCKGLNKKPRNCSSFTSFWHHTNWSVKLHWRV